MLNGEKTDLSKHKKKREQLQKENQKMKQKTGIVNNKSLKTDFEKREIEKTMLEENIISLKDYHAQLTQLIERANQVQMSKMTN
mmetsp:Transcript_1740/g.1667  ORF Transcript_1740/g.1667 Transcript_1740/m.1667 type:complete len:84 (+) Transcript_1740:142-393(+)